MNSNLDGLAAVRHLAQWSPWVPFGEAVSTAPRLPGVYLAALADGVVIYVGMAGLRNQGGKANPQGVRGRLARYASGKAIASGLGEAVLDRALADPDWLRERLAELESGTARRASDWGRQAFIRADLTVCWSTTPDGPSARTLEKVTTETLQHAGALWNRTV